ncbi:MAG: glutamate--tRNA ligase, partial [Treponemataceae bacterium]|nr:glutamate--tRNA ligase [Treponemataceae bacterium]
VNGSDGQKLSKRHGATSVNEFRARGYLPKAIVNYVSMLGCSYEDGRDMYEKEELARLFRLEHLNKAGAVFDYKKLEWFNGQYIRAMSDEELYNAVLPFITGTGDAALPVNASEQFPAPKVGPAVSGIALDGNGNLVLASDEVLASGAFGLAPVKSVGNLTSDQIKEKLMALMPLIKERLHFLTDAAEMVRFLFTEPAVPPKEQIIPKKLDEAKTKEVLERSKDFIKALPGMEHEEQENLARSIAEEMGIKMGDFMMPIRMAVTGSRVSPPLMGSILILGVEKSLERVEKTLATF